MVGQLCGREHVHVKLSDSLNDGNTINQHQCQVIVKDPEKPQDPAGIRTQDLLITVRHFYHRATGSLVAEECRMDVNILRIEFKPRQ